MQTLRLPCLNNEPKVTQSFSTKGLYSKNDIFSCIRNDIVPRSLETFCESTKEYLTNENELKKSKLVQQTNGKYVFVNENGIAINKYGPFWPKTFSILHSLPKFIKSNQDNIEYYADKSLDFVTESNLGHDQYTSEWKNNIIIYDSEKSPRIQEPLIFSHIFSPTLIFESRFESGNLRQVRRRGQFEYELLLRTDLYTEKHTQWYFFKVTNMLPNTTYRFRIINLRKPSSLYNEGLRPLIYSKKNAEINDIGWYRTGHHISYYQNISHRMNPLLRTNETYYELDFQLEFSHEKDECYIAHCYPYTYTDLKDTIDTLEEKCANKRCFLRDLLCETRAGNTCFLLTVTDFNESEKNKMVVVVTARVHPGETNASYMMKGLLDYLTSDDDTAINLRRKFIFKIIPMLNPDGVIIGNYRCSLSGKDMNRNYRHPKKGTFPGVWHLKDLLIDLKKNYEIFGFFDLHGHSRKSNSFTYGCSDPQQPENMLFARMFPWIMSQTAPHLFSYDSCRYKIRKSKESTARVVIWRELNIKACYTFEMSLAGTTQTEKPYHFNTTMMESFGVKLCLAIWTFYEATKNQETANLIFNEIVSDVLKNMAEEEEENEENKELFESESEIDDDEDNENSPKSHNDCLNVIEKYKNALCDESESSFESDSDSEPELMHIDPKQKKQAEPKSQDNKNNNTNNEKKKSNQKTKILKRRPVRSHDISSKKAGEPKRPTVDRSTSLTNISLSKKKTEPSQNQQLMNENKIASTAKKPPLSSSTLYTSRYTTRTSHGMPIFTLERAEERILQRQKRFLEPCSINICKTFTNDDKFSLIETHKDSDLSEDSFEDLRQRTDIEANSKLPILNRPSPDLLLNFLNNLPSQNSLTKGTSYLGFSERNDSAKRVSNQNGGNYLIKLRTSQFDYPNSRSSFRPDKTLTPQIQLIKSVLTPDTTLKRSHTYSAAKSNSFFNREKNLIENEYDTNIQRSKAIGNFYSKPTSNRLKYSASVLTKQRNNNEDIITSNGLGIINNRNSGSNELVKPFFLHPHKESKVAIN